MPASIAAAPLLPKQLADRYMAEFDRSHTYTVGYRYEEKTRVVRDKDGKFVGYERYIDKVPVRRTEAKDGVISRDEFRFSSYGSVNTDGRAGVSHAELEAALGGLDAQALARLDESTRLAFGINGLPSQIGGAAAIALAVAAASSSASVFFGLIPVLPAFGLLGGGLLLGGAGALAWTMPQRRLRSALAQALGSAPVAD